MFPVYNLKVVDKPEEEPASGSKESASTKPILDKKFDENLNYDEEVNRLLDQVKEEFLRDKPENDDLPEDIREFLRNNPEKYDVPVGKREILRNNLANYDFPDDTHHVGSIPSWYRDMLRYKIQMAKSRLENLSDLVCATSPSTAAHIKRIEEDHSTTFCKMDYPRHPPVHKSWRNTWELRYAEKCKETNSNHTHSDDCKSLVVVDLKTGVCVNSPNICQHDYPPHVVRVATLFESFAYKLNKKMSISKVRKGLEDDWWTTTTMVLISNRLNELMIVVRRKIVKPLLPHLKKYFKSVIGTNPNIVSIWGFQIGKLCKRTRRWLNGVTEHNSNNELLIAGTPMLKDEIGPVSVQYNLANHRVPFDSVETMQLGKIIQDYVCLSKETTLLDIGSNVVLLSLIMAHKCEKVVKLIVEPQAKGLINESERLKKVNQIHNVSFVEFKTKDIMSICDPLIRQCITVAIVKLDRIKPIPCGPLKDMMKALRNLLSIWQVIICGSFNEELHESIAVLTSEDNSMGGRFWPMQGCILDKSPRVVDAFDLVILFERKSLIAPKVELFAPGPTVNVPSTSQDGQLDRSTNDQTTHSLSEKNGFRFDHPPPPLGTFPPYSHPPPSLNEGYQFNIPPAPFRRTPFYPNTLEALQNNYPPFFDSRFPNPHFHPNAYPPMRVNFPFNRPHPMLERYSVASIFQGPHLPLRHDFQEYYFPPLPPENFYNSAHHPNPGVLVGNEFQNYYLPPPPPLPSTPPPVLPKNKKASPKKKKPQFFYPPPPPTRFPSPPPPPQLPLPEETDLLDNVSTTSTTGSDERMEIDEEDNVSDIVNAEEDVIPNIVIKSEPIDPSYSADFSEANDTLSEATCHSPTTTVKDELMQVCEDKASYVVNTREDVISSVFVKSEPIDPSYSIDLSEVNDTLSEASSYSSTRAVKSESLQDEVKKESNKADCETNVKYESLQDQEKNESKLATSSCVTVKLEPTNESSSLNFSDTNCLNIPLPATTKSELTAFSSIRSPDCKPMDMQMSPSLPDFQSMETPIHNPRALSDITPVALSKNVSVAGSEFPVQTNQSFLDIVKPKAADNVDREPGEISDSDGENEEKNKQQNKLPQKKVSTAPVVSRKLNRPPRPFPGKYSESRHKRRNRRSSPSPKRMRRSPTPDRRRRRSPVSDRRRERSRRSPLVNKREAHGRARSPIELMQSNSVRSSRDRRNRRSRSRSPRRR